MSKKNIYEMLNDTHTEAVEAPLSAAERQRLLAQARPKVRRRYRKPMAALLAAAVLIGAIALPSGRQAIADGIFRLQGLAPSAWSEDQDGSFKARYATAIGAPAAYDGGQLRVDGILVDDHYLNLNVLYEPADGQAAESIPVVDLVRVAVNGKPMQLLGSGGGAGPLEGHPGIIQNEIVYQAQDAFPAEPFKLTLDFAKNPLSPKFTRFETTIDPAALAKDTIQKDLGLDLGGGYVLDSLKFNAMQQSFVVTHKDDPKVKREMISLRGHDAQGHAFEFGLRNADTDASGIYKARLDYESVLDSATVRPEALVKEPRTLTLQLYAVPIPEEGGRIDERQARPVGAPVTVSLP